jgi:uncharacterized protein
VRLLLTVLAFGALASPVVLGAHGSRDIRAAILLNWVLATLLAAVMLTVERLTVGRSATDVGLGRRNATRGLLCGAALGTALFSIVVLELAAAGFYRITAVHVTRDLVLAALVLLPSAAIEELLFRGVLFRLVEEWLGTWIALAVSAAVFGFAHAANPGASWLSSLAIALEAGVLLGAAFVVARNLWFPIGLHFAWNFFEGPVYGTQVSGRSFLTAAVVAHVTGPRLFTGGSFGPEAGLFAIVTCVVAAVALLIVATRRSLIVFRASTR